jgi:hypothetical protein
MADSIQQECFLTGCALANLAAYIGLSRSALSEKLSAGRLSADEDARARETLRVMQLVQHDAGFPIAWDQVSVIKPKLEARITAYRESLNPTPTFVYVIRLSSASYFRRIQNGEVLTTPSLGNCFMSENLEVTQQAIKMLAEKYHMKAAWDSFTNTVQRKASSMCTSLEDVGLQ